MASDPGDASWLDQVAPGPWLDGVDWLFVSGYALLRAARPGRSSATAAAARAAGARVAVDLASAAMIEHYGPARFRPLWQSLEPVGGLRQRRRVGGRHHGTGDTPGVVRSRRTLGPRAQARSRRGQLRDRRGPEDRPPVDGPVVDATGAGDSLTAGYLVGGADLAMSDRRACIGQRRRAAGGAGVTGLTVRGVEIRADELHWRFSRSGGPGGQSVNTADSRVELSFDVLRSPSLPAHLRDRAVARLARRLVDGVLTITASEYRSQHRNRQAARARLADVLTRGHRSPGPAAGGPPSRPAGPSERRLAGKKRRGRDQGDAPPTARRLGGPVSGRSAAALHPRRPGVRVVERRAGCRSGTRRRRRRGRR